MSWAPTARAAASTSASARLGAAVGDGVPDRPGEEVRLLGDDARAGAGTAEVQLAQIVPSTMTRPPVGS